MIPCHRDAAFEEIFVQGIYIFSGCAVNDSALASMPADVVCHKGILVFSGNVFYLVIQIFSVKACYYDAGLLKLQDALNINLNFLCGCGRKCTYNGAPGEALDKVNNL